MTPSLVIVARKDLVKLVCGNVAVPSCVLEYLLE